jgi:hypothetical protein
MKFRGENSIASKPNIYRLFGILPETETSWEDCLASLHREFTVIVIML